MAQVPYSGVPQQNLELIPNPEMNPRVPAAAFGGGVADAISGLGKATEHAGNEIWAQAVKLQDLNNHAEVDKADAEFMKQAGMLHADFSAKQGMEAKQAFPKYMEDLQSVREGIGKTLSNPASQKMYNSTSLSTMGRTIFNGAGHAATQLKSASIDAVSSRIGTNVGIASTSSDPATVESARQTALGLNHRLHELKGTPESTSDSEFIINSSINANVLVHQAEDDPSKAVDAYEKLQSLRGKITKEDYDRADRSITNKIHANGAATIAGDILAKHTDTEGNVDASTAELQKEARDRAAKDLPNDAIYQDHVVKALEGKLNQNRYAVRQAKWDNVQIMDQNIQSSGATNMDELLADPRAAAAYKQLPASEQNKLPARLNNYIKARDYSYNQQSMTALDGMRKNDVTQFLDSDPTDPKWKLSQQQIRTVNGWREELKKNPNQDPQVNRAMSMIRQTFGAQMDSLGIRNRNSKDATDYDHFTGLLSESLEAWQQAHGKPAEYQDIKEKIAPQLFQQHSTTGFLGGLFGPGKSDPYFKDLIQSKDYKQFSKDFTTDRVNRGEVQPGEEETTRAYYRRVGQTLYGKKEPK